MIRRLALLAALAAPIPLHAQTPTAVDTTGAGALLAQAMDHSELMDNLQFSAT